MTEVAVNEGPVSFDSFVDRLRLSVPLPEGATEETTIAEICGSDRLQRTLLLGQIMGIGGGMPEEMLAGVKTLGEAFHWCETRRSNGSTTSPAPSYVADALTTPRVRLRPVHPADIEWIYETAASPQNGFRWILRGLTPNPQHFSDTLYRGTLAIFVVERRGGEICGLVDAYDANTADGHVRIAIVSADNAALRPSRGVAPGHVFEGAYLFIRYLFRTFDFRKIYADVPGFNWPQLESGEGTLFTVEGVLTGHDYHDGAYWDRRIVSITRSGWEEFSRAWDSVLQDVRRS